MTANQPEEPTSYPYGGSSGHSGTDTSKRRADHADDTGKTSDRQARVIEILRGALGDGITVRELRDITGWHHGTASGVLSVLHLDGRIARLSQTRTRCKIYVHRDHVNSRPTEPHGRAGKTAVDEAALTTLLNAHRQYDACYISERSILRALDQFVSTVR